MEMQVSKVKILEAEKKRLAFLFAEVAVGLVVSMDQFTPN